MTTTTAGRTPKASIKRHASLSIKLQDRQAHQHAQQRSQRLKSGSYDNQTSPQPGGNAFGNVRDTPMG